MPKVSVIIPTHDRAEFLRAAISSVLKQTYQDFELIVVDDASDQDCREVVSRFNDQRIKYIRHPINKGDGGSRNTGIVNSTGRYVAFLDDDDEWLPEKLEAQVELVESRSAKIGGVYTGLFKVNKTTGKIMDISIPKKRGDLFRDMFIDSPIVTSCVLLRRECFDKVGLFDERIPYNNDYDMWIRIAHEYHFEYINEPLVLYHAHEGKLTRNLKLVLQGWEMVLEKYQQCFASNKRHYGRLNYNLGILYCLTGDLDKSRKAFFKAITSHPVAIKPYLMCVVSLMHAALLRNLIKVNERITLLVRQKRLNQRLRILVGSSSLPTVRSICRSAGAKPN